MTSEYVEYKISEIATIVGGGTPKTSNEAYFDGDIPWITPKDMSDNPSMYTSSGYRSLSEEGLSSCSAKMIPAGSILMSSRAPVGLLTISANPVCTNQGIRSLILNEDIADAEYVYYKLRTMLSVLEAYSSGATFPEISGSSFGKITIILPSIKQQKLISRKLRDLDSMMEKSGIISSIINHQLSILFRSWFIDFDPVKAKTEGKLPYGMDEETAALFPDSFEDSELGKIPAGWEIVSLADCIQANARVGWKGLSVSEYVDSGPYIVTGPQLVSGNIDWQKCGHVPLFRYEESPDIMLQENDVLLTKDGTIGKVALVHSMPGKATLAAGLFRLRAKEEVCGHGFVLCLLNSYLFDSLIWTKVEGAVIPHLYQVHLRAFKFAIPGPELMFEFEKKVNPLIELIKKSAQTITHLERTRYALLPRLMSGEL